jgi:hypothetical protein
MKMIVNAARPRAYQGDGGMYDFSFLTHDMLPDDQPG